MVKTPQGQLEELWSLVDELGELSERMRRAADGALDVLCSTDDQDRPPEEGDPS